MPAYERPERLPRPTLPRRYMKWPVVLGGMLGLAIFGVGLATVLWGAGSAAEPLVKVVRGQDADTPGAVTYNNAAFPYLVPKHKDWDFKSDSVVFDQGKGVVKYQVVLKDPSLPVVISQQVMPSELKPQTSAKFNQLVLSSNVVRSQEAGKGKVYFQAALTNGAQANGATNVMYATDDILLFGHAPMVMGYDKWAELLSSMELTGKK